MSRVASVVACTATCVSVASSVVAYVALKRTGPTGEGEVSRLTLPERVNKLELERMHFSVFLKHQEEELLSIKRLEEQITSVETRIEMRSAAVSRPGPRTAPEPRSPPPPARANWWCYLGRECFRAQSACISDDDDRKSECRPYRTAWCGGVDGKACFAGHGDCFALQIPMPEYGKPMPAAGRSCVELE